MTHDAERNALVDALSRSGRVTRESVLEAIRTVSRHEFVPEEYRDRAYEDRPLPIGHDQTVSAPHMVAIICDHLALSPGDRVLEIGTGCGYHAAVTAELVGAGNVYSIEFQSELADAARERLARLGYGGVHVRAGDGHEGWPEHAPYDAAYLTCAAASLPDSVVEQVRPGGRVVAPVGTDVQELVVVEKGEDGSLDRRTDGRVRFVPMRGE
ncbi:protein-L-isoaspartate(D-aspartate) O-methyltransferase [Halomarina litorea]|uniref:protein-L-isoaspartate(D-aspartate) O-methyltransferase n=1 Tax=Halomarina litorea TaxID=2961595 RepID=UPI0020C2A871|nr:protein-L-isoaspartate(D-aspartate) O-methyltransferase [Halomarina sp. BCD28]